MWYDCQSDNSPQETKMTQKLTTIGHCAAFNNEQSPYLIMCCIYKFLNVVTIVYMYHYVL